VKSIASSAPGKLVLLGEYAVLEGAPALVLAVNRRARVTCTACVGDAWQLASPTLGLDARLRITTKGPVWDGESAPELDWIASLCARLPFAASLPACRVELDSDAFHLDHAGAREKLGLGSSAALTVALLGALHALGGQPAPTLGECVATHRAIQHGRGSGIDVAASLHGGLLRFQLDAGHAPHIEPLALPAGLHWRCVYSGRPASTSAMLATVAAWRTRQPAEYTRRIHELATMGPRGVDAVARADSAAFLANLHAYAIALAGLGDASGADIASPAHRALGEIARECGVVYKSCGAGGGDVGVTFSVDDIRLQEFSERAGRAGFPVIEMQAAASGLEVLAVA
jgi:phosphomevalonate kinase